MQFIYVEIISKYVLGMAWERHSADILQYDIHLFYSSNSKYRYIYICVMKKVCYNDENLCWPYFLFLH